MSSSADVQPALGGGAAGQRRRKTASESEIMALHATESPLVAASPYHAFARCPPTTLFGKPRLWPGPEGSATTARLLWNEEALYVCWETEGVVVMPLEPSRIETASLKHIEDMGVQADQCSILLDERVECFLWQQPEGPSEAKRAKVDGSQEHPCSGQTYYAFEINYKGKALTSRAKFDGSKGFDWDSTRAYRVWTREMSVGWGASASPVPSAVKGMSPPFKQIVVAEFQWGAMDMDPGREIRIGLHRAEYPASSPGRGPSMLGAADVARIQGDMVWTSWIDPGDAIVNFHRTDCFGRLVFAPARSGVDCSCCAARLFRSRELTVLRSPQPSLDECPPGSLLVRAKFASLCGSDLPYFRDSASKAPSCYWDRDGFCGHEVIGIVIASKSDKFKPGDAVMALPSSYFKAHVGSKQEWYRPEVHGVLLESFPVRGGFSQVYTSHELYSYKLKECVPGALAAQGLGTILRMARRVGPVLGKTVLILGQGQNGLMATRLMAQFGAKHVIAADPLEYRRKLAVTFGATQAVRPGHGPDSASEAVAAATDGRGADVVLEMVGHNQDTINEALFHVACAGVVVAFGVPDDRIYDRFEYTEFFRKNVTLIASVIPDPAVDFPEAVRLIDQGRFSTEGLFSHVLPLAEVGKAFTMAADYTDGVVKVVVDLS